MRNQLRLGMKGKEGVLITNAARIVERVTGTHRNTICRLLVEVREGCAKLMDEQMHELPAVRRFGSNCSPIS